MKSIPQANDLISFVKQSEFFNKIQVTSSGKTETLWYLKDDTKWIIGQEDGSGVDTSEDDILQKLKTLPDDSGVLIAGNETSGTLTYNF